MLASYSLDGDAIVQECVGLCPDTLLTQNRPQTNGMKYMNSTALVLVCWARQQISPRIVASLRPVLHLQPVGASSPAGC
jgi:hypothetical protein